MAARPKVGDLVLCEWLDAHASNTWENHAEAAKSEPVAVCSAGKLIRDDDTCMIVAGTWGGDDVNNVITVPKSWIVKVRRLR